jgi:putative PIN family toxin of toxin-antitoxin system
MLKIVLDTNIILSSITSSSPYHIILTSLFQNKYNLIVTSDILLEYEEKLSEKFSAEIAEYAIGALLQNKSVDKVEIFFNLGLIKADEDDNKFVDCAFCGNVNYLVTNDKHFKVLKQVEFPVIKTLSIDEFTNLLKEMI